MVRGMRVFVAAVLLIGGPCAFGAEHEVPTRPPDDLVEEAIRNEEAITTVGRMAKALWYEEQYVIVAEAHLTLLRRYDVVLSERDDYAQELRKCAEAVAILEEACKDAEQRAADAQKRTATWIGVAAAGFLLALATWLIGVGP